MAELRAEGSQISQRSLQRLRHADRDNGLIGLADKRALRSGKQLYRETLRYGHDESPGESRVFHSRCLPTCEGH